MGKMANSFTRSDWRVLLRSIESGDCILLLGPDLNVTTSSRGNYNLASDLADVLAEKLDPRATEHLGPLDLPLIAQAFQHKDMMARDYLDSEVEDFLEEYHEGLGTLVDPTFAGLASLPFRLIITSRHDDTMEKYLGAASFDGKKKEPNIEVYNLHGKRQGVLKDLKEYATRQTPLIYKLFGSPNVRGSMVLTENDRLDFLKSIVSNDPGLPKDLTNAFRGKNFLFVGFGLADYHLKVLMHVLGMNQSAQSFALENLGAGPGGAHSGEGTEEVSSVTTAFKESVWFYRVAGFNRLRLMEEKIEDFIVELCERWEAQSGDEATEDTTDEAGGDAFGDVDEDDPSNRIPKVFLSYASEDVEQAKQLVEIFRRNGLDPWWDKEKLRGGQNYADALEDAVTKDVDYFVVLQSRHVNDYEESYVHRELGYALDRIKGIPYDFIFPAIIDKEAKRLARLDKLKLQTANIDDIKRDGAAFAQNILRIEIERRKNLAEA